MAKVKKTSSFLELSEGCSEAAQNILKQLEKKLEVATAFASSDELKEILKGFRYDVMDAEIGIKNSINYARMARSGE
jgi:hypothetical protein